MHRGFSTQNATVAVFDSHKDVEDRVRQVWQSGFDLSKLSVAAKERRSGRRGFAHYGEGGEVKYLGDDAAFWNRMWTALSGWAFLDLPETGPILVAGPLGGWMAAALDNSLDLGGLSVLGVALYGLGIPRELVVAYEASVKAEKLLLVAHGAASEIARVREALAT